jgi:EAL domain-containing protein (putative c-di-GMP-specific phosphodiesterase class I)
VYWRQRYIIEAFNLALANHWIKVYYQPIVRSDTKKPVKMEALARWIDPTRGTISPGEFIPVLSKYHLLYKLDLYMVEQVCKETRIRREIGLPMIPVTINFSAQDFDHADMVDALVRITARYGVSHDDIIIEITEQDIAQGTEHFLAQLHAIRNNGFKLWLDDFGSGYSSLNVFSQFDVDLVKFDLNLLRHLDDHNGINRTIMRTMVAMANELGIQTLAEGVEKTDQDDFVSAIGCELEQGYYFFRPEPLDDHIFKFRKQEGENLSQENIEKVLSWIDGEGGNGR